MAADNELIKEYNKVMKVADQKLRRLEKLAENPEYKGVLSFSYQKAMKDIEHFSGEGAKRFKTKAPETKTAIISKIKRAQAFIESSTSDKRSIDKIYRTRANTINKKYGTNLSWQDLQNYFRSSASEIIGALMGSNTEMKVLGKIKDPTVKLDAIEQEQFEKVKDLFTAEELFEGNV